MMVRKKWEDLQLVSQRGFTLIELLVVMIIISMLAALVGPRVFNKLGRAKRQAAEAQISQLEAALDIYRLDTGHYPENLEALVDRPPGEDLWDGPYLKKDKIPKDPWKNDYVLVKSGDEVHVKSYGADGQDGGEGENADIPSDSEFEDGRVIPPG
ncbi:MAG: type II secretion system major pseudopilin GspG [bacterium]